MSPENFVYWLRGFLELSGETELTKDQVKMINDHLNLVFEQKTAAKVSYDNGKTWSSTGF